MATLSTEKRSLVIHLHDIQGKSVRDISIETGISKSSVHYTIQRWRETGGVAQRKGAGRPPKATPRVQRSLCRISLANRHLTSPELSRELQESCGVKLQPSTVRQTLRSNGLRGCKAKRKPLLNERQLKARVEWAKAHRHWTAEQWKSVLFSDESTFTVQNHSGNNWVRRRPGEEYLPQCILPTIKHPTSVMVWGCFAASGPGRLHVIEGTMNAKKYIDVLHGTMLPSGQQLFPGRWTFQQDNAPCHTAKVVKKWMADNQLELLPWPAQSPDLNPIENLWHRIGQIVAKDKPTTKRRLIELIIQAWFRVVATESLASLVESMPRRIDAVLRNKGWPTKY